MKRSPLTITPITVRVSDSHGNTIDVPWTATAGEGSARLWWKFIHRRMRIARREASKAATDAMVYGSGAVLIGDDGSISRVPLQSTPRAFPASPRTPTGPRP